jgi:hypothetical protein
LNINKVKESLMKKIGILTQHLHNNYGGLLQAYALQKILHKQGNDVLTIDFPRIEKPRLWGIEQILRNIIRKYLLRRNLKSIFPITEEQKASIGRETRRFVAENIRTTQKITNIDQFSYLDSYQFDAYIVGSDQVWRPQYSPGISAFFLEFLGNDIQTKRIAYAASFGTDNCDEFTETELVKYSALCQKFDGIAVREDSAVELCKNNFSVSVEQVLDPTMLLEKEDYIDLINKDDIPSSAGNMMVYVLDRSPEKESMINQVAETRGLKPFTVMPTESTGVFPPVTQWLQGFMGADYVVTDSFHGVAFCIIFNKPFIAIGNKSRGLARFTSVLKKFDLESRLVLEPSELTKDKINASIDFTKVNEIRVIEQNFAFNFLQNLLDNKNK